MEPRDSHGDFLQRNKVYVSVNNPHYLCYLVSKEGSDWELIDVNGQDPKRSSELFEGWGRCLTPVSDVAEALRKYESSVAFLKMIKDTRKL